MYFEPIFPSCYRPQRSCGKVMFSQVSVILFTGGCASQHALGQTPPCRPPPTGRPPGQTPPAQCILGYTPHTHTGGYCSGRYASYWNAFLFEEVCILLRPLVDFFQLGFNNTSLLIISTVYAS